METGGNDGWREFVWPAFVRLDAVRVAKLREATFSADWQIVATAGGHPWIAIRQMNGAEAGNTMMIWLASEPRAQTNWTNDPSFVLFFAEMANRAWGGGGGGKTVAWDDVSRAGDNRVEGTQRI